MGCLFARSYLNGLVTNKLTGPWRRRTTEIAKPFWLLELPFERPNAISGCAATGKERISVYSLLRSQLEAQQDLVELAAKTCGHERVQNGIDAWVQVVHHPTEVYQVIIPFHTHFLDFLLRYQQDPQEENPEGKETEEEGEYYNGQHDNDLTTSSHLRMVSFRIQSKWISKELAGDDGVDGDEEEERQEEEEEGGAVNEGVGPQRNYSRDADGL